ncbi:hypothetical protein ETB97_010268 [Aspergillus alliaceus]|uniref:Uncharacterized protein n=1 Tax=Petromyces alliaceus TaxID=209559 RepID=A0A5N6GBZ2_PETAA|nr:uncharacterized protein BDW43DRAFT_75964 [Aspergillus alliaceus]KAB8239245.1 hypothetical protein BDW43DRAFT_75964 [Aspergillus alliaceus]KAE8395696.1 hypothetical protein BDV23DRAFT_80323 [Aspergillus alliaceus]KAF5855030.1 hypothetical protein ETB97_010268 [Aspergillus burnettii]
MVPHNRPRPRITFWMRVRRFIYTFESPLRLRGTLIRLSHRHKYPILALLRLLLPLPTWHFRVPEPVPLRIMLNNIPLLESRMASADLTNMRSVPIWRARDTPIRSLYRLYEAMAAREYYAIGPEVEYFWYQRSWTLCCVPDPRDPDPVRYAILACITEELAKAFNWRLSLGMRRDRRKHVYRKTLDEVLPSYTPETAPTWTKSVPAIDIELIADLPDDALDASGRLVLEAGGKSPVFAERNIVTDTGHFYTV